MSNTYLCGVFVHWPLYFVCIKCKKASIRSASFVFLEGIIKPVFNLTCKNLHWEVIKSK